MCDASSSVEGRRGGRAAGWKWLTAVVGVSRVEEEMEERFGERERESVMEKRGGERPRRSG